MQSVYGVPRRVVKAKDNISLDAVGIIHEEIRDRRAVRDELHTDTLC